MKLYRVVQASAERGFYQGDRSESHAYAKALFLAGRWDLGEDRIEYVEIEVNKENVLLMLDHIEPVVEVIKTWALTERGGLKEVPNGD